MFIGAYIHYFYIIVAAEPILHASLTTHHLSHLVTKLLNVKTGLLHEDTGVFLKKTNIRC
jgi:hypothetical protein